MYGVENVGNRVYIETKQYTSMVQCQVVMKIAGSNQPSFSRGNKYFEQDFYLL